MVGFFAAAAALVPGKAVRDAVEHGVPAGTETLNLAAFDAGWAAFEADYRPPRGG